MPKNEFTFLYINTTEITNSDIRIIHSKYTCLERKARNILPTDKVRPKLSLDISSFISNHYKTHFNTNKFIGGKSHMV